MRRLLLELCTELDTRYRGAAVSYGLPVDYLRWLGRSLPLGAYANWKVVGWIEELNDLVYFLDVLDQLRAEPGGRVTPEFAGSLFTECEGKFYEHHYLDDLFPTGVPTVPGLRARLHSLCRVLAQQVLEESLFLVPGLPCQWIGRVGSRAWTVPCCLQADFERAEPEGCVPFGYDGAHLHPPPTVRRELERTDFQGLFRIRAEGVRLVVGRQSAVLPVRGGGTPAGWRLSYPTRLLGPDPTTGHAVTLGPTVIYGQDRRPRRIAPTDPTVRLRIMRALQVLEAAWPPGFALFACLTSRLVPLRASGVVSFSYRHRPGLSFVNCFERDDLDLIDDLVHENGHHHLNLLLRHGRLYRAHANQELFYSPWRRALRPVRGVLHATFTFTMGALLFAQLSRWGEATARARPTSGGVVPRERLGDRHLLRARFRGLEEIDSVRYAMRDLRGPAARLGWITPRGLAMLGELERHLRTAVRLLAPHRADVERSPYGAALRRHRGELEAARRRYRLRGPG